MDTRVGKTDSTGTYSYERDGVDVTDPVLNDAVAEYTPGISENRSGTSAFYHADRLGSTTKISNSSASVTDARQFAAFGMLVSSTGTNPTPFGFVGQEGYQSDPDTGLMLLGHRYYDPSTGKFLTRDILKSGDNWYSYCDNNPLARKDPSGNNWGGFLGGLLGAAIGVGLCVAGGGVPIIVIAVVGAEFGAAGGGLGSVLGGGNVNEVQTDAAQGAVGGFCEGLFVPEKVAALLKLLEGDGVEMPR